MLSFSGWRRFLFCCAQSPFGQRQDMPLDENCQNGDMIASYTTCLHGPSGSGLYQHQNCRLCFFLAPPCRCLFAPGAVSCDYPGRVSSQEDVMLRRLTVHMSRSVATAFLIGIPTFDVKDVLFFGRPIPPAYTLIAERSAVGGIT